MEEQLFKKIKLLQSVQPRKEFTEQSRRLVLAAPQASPLMGFFTRVIDTLKYSAALGLATVLLFLFIGGFSYFKITNISPLVLTSFEAQGLEQEVQSLDFRIQLGQAKYFDEATQQVAESEKAIDELLNQITL